MSTLLGEDIELVGAGSTQDTIKKYVVVVNPHDGQRKFKARVTPIRPVCRNTVDWGEEGALTSWEIRHTTTIADKLKVAQESLGLAGVYYDKFATDAQAMISTRLTGKAFEQFLDQLWPVADEMKKTAKDNRYKVRDKVREIYEEDPQQAHIRKTAWGAAQAAIQYDDWETAVKPPKSLTEDVVRAHRVFTGDREDEKSRIRRAAMTLVNR
jgi:phage/plasmid-like protein (TIGR03299 family)